MDYKIKCIIQDKLLHLQKEITLMHIKYKITCLSSRSNDDITTPIKIAQLKKQQSELLLI